MKTTAKLLAGAACAALSGSALAYAEAGHDVAKFHEGPYWTDSGFASDAVLARSGTPGCTGSCSISNVDVAASAYADASRLALGGYAAVDAFNTGWAGAASTASYLENSFTVRSATLEEGSALTLHVSVSLLGSLRAEFGANSSGEAHFGVVDGATVMRPGFGEFWQPTLLSLDAGWRLSYSVGGMVADAGWGVNLSHGYDANGYDLPDFAYVCSPGRTDCGYSRTAFGDDMATASYAVNGLVVDLPVQVGHTYTVYGSLTLGPTEAEGVSFASADFSHTLGAAVSDPGGQATLDWTVPMAPVPEVPSWLMLAAGALFMGVRRLPLLRR